MKNHRDINSIKIDRANHSKFSFQIWGILLLTSLVASLATIPYASALLYQNSAPPISTMLAIALLDFVILSVPLTSLGLWSSSKLGLGTPVLEAILTNGRPQNYHRFRPLILMAVVLGLVGGIFIHAIDILSQPFLPSELMEVEIPSFFPALLGSFGAAVNEEIWLRLGVMSCLVWLGSKLSRRSKPTKRLVWSANLLAAFGFGMLHLPQAFTLAQESSAFLITIVLLLNGFVGVIFGWLYWRCGLLAAMIAHFSTDVIIHVIPALFVTSLK